MDSNLSHCWSQQYVSRFFYPVVTLRFGVRSRLPTVPVLGLAALFLIYSNNNTFHWRRIVTERKYILTLVANS